MGVCWLILGRIWGSNPSPVTRKIKRTDEDWNVIAHHLDTRGLFINLIECFGNIQCTLPLHTDVTACLLSRVYLSDTLRTPAFATSLLSHTPFGKILDRLFSCTYWLDQLLLLKILLVSNGTTEGKCSCSGWMHMIVFPGDKCGRDTLFFYRCIFLYSFSG